MSIVRREFLRNSKLLFVDDKSSLQECICLGEEEVSIITTLDGSEEDILNFYIPLTESLFKAFNFGIDFSETDDWINAYVLLYPKANRVEMEFSYHCEDGSNDFAIEVFLIPEYEQIILESLAKAIYEKYSLILEEYVSEFVV